MVNNAVFLENVMASFNKNSTSTPPWRNLGEATAFNQKHFREPVDFGEWKTLKIMGFQF